MQAPAAAGHSQLLQIYRDFLRSGAEDAYREIEEEAARICVRFNCPNPYLAIEALTGVKEVWYFNGYRSEAHKDEVAQGYRGNAPLMAALNGIARRKADLVLSPVDLLTVCRPDLSRGTLWRVGDGRFLIVTVSNGVTDLDGTVFVSEEGTHFTLRAVQSRAEADIGLRSAGQDARVFAVRPRMSMPAEAWVRADPEFWEEQ